MRHHVVEVKDIEEHPEHGRVTLRSEGVSVSLKFLDMQDLELYFGGKRPTSGDEWELTLKPRGTK